MLELVQTHTERLLWDSKYATEPGPARYMVRGVRFVYALIRDFFEGQLTLRAMGLVYTTLLSLVPLIAFSFSILKSFGVHQHVRPALLNVMAPLGDMGQEITERIIEFVENVRVDALALVGFLILMYTAISLVQKVENSFNYIWHVSGPRSIGRRFSEYLSVIMVGPVLMAVAVGAGASITNNAVVQYLASTRGVDTAIILLGKLTPFALVTTTFTFLYAFIPNTKVRLSSALVGGVTAGLLWVTIGFLFASFVASSTKYTAIYSSFAILILFLIWLYVGWLILMVGAQISFYFQNPEYLRHGRIELDLSNRSREHLSLQAMQCIGESFLEGDHRWDMESLSRHFRIPGKDVDRLLNRLRHAGLVVETENGKLMPGRALEEIKISEVLQAVRKTQGGTEPTTVLGGSKITDIMENIEGAIADSLTKRSLRDLLTRDPG